MLVYRDGGGRANTRGELARLRRAADSADRSRDAALGFLIQVAEFEAGVADALAPERDSWNQTTSLLRAISEEAAAAWLAFVRSGVERRAARSLARRLTQFEAMRLPNSIELRVSEGFAYYALLPETYVASAERFAADRGTPRVHAIGIRSIGTSLSAIVTATLRHAGCAATSSSVRPHGHPFDRAVDVDDTLAELLRREAAHDAWFAIVDEGPGLSGSSFAAVASYLRSLDIPESRIALFPSWEPDPRSLRSETARRVWTAHPRYCAQPDPSSMPKAVFGLDESAVDWSGGRWRATLYPPGTLEVPAVQPQHERVKVYVPGTSRVIRFAGLGPYGEAIAARAATLANLGIGAPGELRSGFIDLPFVPGEPLARCDSVDDASTIGRYVARVADAFPTGGHADTNVLRQMIETNLEGVVHAARIDLPSDIPAVALDGRMLAHEWIRTHDRRLVKVDALDHHGGHFLPGPQSPAWDLAGAEIELTMSAAQAAAMLEAFERESRDRVARRVLPFYRLAYAAFRFGYVTLAAATLAGSDDGAAFERAARVYSQCALNAAACFTASPKSPLKQIARSSMNT